MADNPEKLRLDQLLVQRGFYESREKAQRALMAGMVVIQGIDRLKPGMLVAADTPLHIAGNEKYVGRGGLKLEAALDAFAIAVSGKVCLDIGASTGGFTDCLLQRGAAKVHAIDVGHSQLAWKIRSDSRVVVKEGLNARYLSYSDIGEKVDLCVSDVSFISLTLILNPAFQLLQPDASMLVLIKPQFELEKSQVGKGGVVRDASAHALAVEKIRRFVLDNGHQWLGVIDSPITGAKGNQEFIAHLKS